MYMTLAKDTYLMHECMTACGLVLLWNCALPVLRRQNRAEMLNNKTARGVVLWTLLQSSCLAAVS